MPFFRPRIYQFDASEPNTGSDAAGLSAELESEIRDAAAAGFDHLLCDAGTAAAGVLAAAKSAGLAPLLRLPSLSLERAAPSAAASDELPDPRFAKAARPQPSTDFSDAHAQQRVQRHWSKRLAETVRADGWAGVCLGLGGAEPPAVFKAVIASVKAAAPDCKFLAWTPGVAAERLAHWPTAASTPPSAQAPGGTSARPGWPKRHCACVPFGALIATVAVPKPGPSPMAGFARCVPNLRASKAGCGWPPSPETASWCRARPWRFGQRGPAVKAPYPPR
jgi:hypothetical protein